MLCETATARGSSGPDLSLLERPGWSYELKLDGVRILAEKEGRRVKLVYRSGLDASSTYPEIVEAMAELAAERVVLDGEVVAFDDAGRPSFERLQRRIGLGRKRASRHEVPVAYVVFDVLAHELRDVTGLPLRDRRALLARIVPGSGCIRTLDHLEEDGTPLFELCKKQGLEGVIAKRDDSPYLPGRRSADWIKIKAERSDELVVVGWTRGRGGGIGALDLASYEGGRLVTRGKVGSGIGEATARRLLERFESMEIPACAAEGPLEPAPLGRTFVRPEIVVSVRFHSWTEDGRLRQPVFRGVRDDVLPDECNASPNDGTGAREDEVTRYYEAVASALAPYVAPSRGKREVLARVAQGQVTFDLACGPYLAFAVRDAQGARSVRTLIERIGLVAFPKTAATGLEVVVPLGRGAPPETCRALGQLLARLLPEATLLARVLAPYSLLAACSRRVSTPLAWDELDVDPRTLTIRTVVERLAARGDLMAGLPKARVALARAVERLEQILKSL
jgi:bifunctional non-homologous end joining protein LigD